MKRAILAAVLALAVLAVPAVADELDGVDTGSESSAPTVDADAVKTDEGVTVNVTISQPEAPAPVESMEEAPVDAGEDTVEAAPSVQSYTSTAPDVLASPAGVDGSPSMADVLTSLFGEYQRRTYTVTQYDGSGSVIATSTEYVPGLAGLDYEWLSGVALFALLLTGFFKLLGGVFRR